MMALRRLVAVFGTQVKISFLNKNQKIIAGLKGNANNFLSRESCQQNCLQLLATELQSVKKEATNFCLRGEPIKDKDENLLKCGPEDGNSADCPDTHFCHLGHTSSHSGCCQKTGLSFKFLYKN